MTGCILLPELMAREIERRLGVDIPASIRQVLASKPIRVPLEYQFTTSDGDRCRVIAWSEEHARSQVKEDGRFPGELTVQGTAPAWPGLGCTRIVCPDWEQA